MPPPLRILFVSSHAVLGGAEAVMRTLMLGLGPGFVARAVVLQEGPFADRLADDGVLASVVPAPKGAGMLRAARELRSVIAAERPDVVHANGLKAALICTLAGRGRPGRLLWMKHDTTGDGALARLVAFGCDDVVGVSSAVMRSFGRRRRRRGVVPNGLPPRRIDRAAARAEVLALLGESDVEVVTICGRLSVGKGQHELIAALPALARARPRARVLVLGGPDPAFPDYPRELHVLAEELAVADRICFAGHREDAARLVAGADVLAAPSVRDPSGWREGFGLAVAEAMQAGTPVAAYASGSLPEVLGDAGILVDEGDRGGLAAALAHLLANPGRRAELGARGVQRVATRFTLDRALEQMRGRYRSLTDTSRKSRT